MTSSSEQDSNGKAHAASGVQPITREDEGRVREAIHRAMLSVIEGREPPLLHFAPDGMLKTIESSEGFGLCAAELGALARAGIVPGPDGWRWAAAHAPIAKGDRLCSRTTGRVYTARAFLSDFTRYPGGPLQGPGWKLEDEDEDGMPAWETVSDLNNTEKWERVGPRLAPTVILDAPSQPAGMGEQRAIAAAVAGAPEDRPSQLRAALLSVLSRGPVEGLARLLPALDAAMGEAPGVARATGAEARQAAREVGAVVDGARWSLPAMVPGWGWRLSYVPRCWFLTRLDAEDVEGGSVATVESEHGAWGWQLAGAPAWSEADTLAEAQTAALLAARRAGLFAPRSAPATDEVTGPAPEELIHVRVARVLGVEVERVVVVSEIASGTVERVEVDGLTVHEETLDKLRAAGIKVRDPAPSASPINPLVALAGHLCGVHAYEPGSEGMRAAMSNAAGLAPLLAAWGAALVEQARAPRHTIEAIGEQSGTVTAQRVHGEGGEVGPMPHPTDSASVQAQAAAILQRDTIDPAWGALEARATAAEAHAIHWRARAVAAERAAAEARLEAEAAAAARDTLARDYAAERALSESLRAQLDEAETARDDARAALSDLRAALADLAARWAGGAA